MHSTRPGVVKLGAPARTGPPAGRETDMLACPRCGGRMVVLATIEDPAEIRRILTHLGLSTQTGEPLAPRAPP